MLIKPNNRNYVFCNASVMATVMALCSATTAQAAAAATGDSSTFQMKTDQGAQATVVPALPAIHTLSAPAPAPAPAPASSLEPYSANTSTTNKQSALDKTIETIVISAKREGVPPHLVASSVLTMSADDLVAWSIESTSDIAKSAANIDLRMRSPMNASIAIRGVGAENWHINANQGVAQVLDDSTIQGNYGGKLAMFDIQGVALYRGPQNGLFGINSTGGALYFESNKPQLGEHTGYGEVSAGVDGLLNIQGAVNLPLADNVATRVSLYNKKRDPLWLNKYNDSKMGSIDATALRWHVLWDLPDDQSWLMTYQYGKDDSSRSPYIGIGFWDGDGSNVEDGRIIDLNAPIDCPALLPFRSSNYTQASNCVTVLPFSGNTAIAGGTDDWYSTYDGAQDISNVTFHTAKLKYKKTFAWGDMVSVSVFDSVDSKYVESLNNNPNGLAFMPSQELDKTHWSQEFRISNLSSNSASVSGTQVVHGWMLGGSYSQSDDYFGTVITRTDNGGAPFGIVPSVTIEQDTKILSVFGLHEYRFDEQWLLSTTLRYTNNKQEGISTVRVLAKTETGTPSGQVLPSELFIDRQLLESLTASPSGPCPPNVGGLPCKSARPVAQSSHLTGGNISVSYFMNLQQHVYAQVSRGFLAGAFDTRALAAFAGTADNAVEPETLDALELGWKYQSAKLSANIAAFYYEWKGKQTFDVNNEGQPAFLNVPGAKLNGMDAQLKWQFTPNWQLNMSLGLLDSKVTDSGTLLYTPEGNSLSYTPSWSHALNLSYTVDIGQGSSVFNLNNRYRSELFSSVSNLPYTELEAQSLWSVSWQHTLPLANGTELHFKGGVENLAGKKYCSSSTNNGTLSYSIQCRPNEGKPLWSFGVGIHF